MSLDNAEMKSMPSLDVKESTMLDSREFDVSAGRSVSIRMGKGSESIVVRSPEGAPEITITFTEQGPCIRLGSCPT